VTGETGGCQCGAVRFRVTGELGDASICHCRMCQKAMGGLFGPFVNVAAQDLIWTRGTRTRFRSSNRVHRGFCSRCGTPLTYEYGKNHLGLALGALDRPADIRPTEQLAPESAAPYFATLAALPVHPSDEPRAAAHLASIESFQHPDHDTAEWPLDR